MKTYSAKPPDIKRQWYLLDASEAPLGRLATVAASLLIGKGKALFTTHVDCGDYVVVINSGNIVVSGAKRYSKIYYSHSGYPSGLTATKLKDQLTKDAPRTVIQAVHGMLPANKLRAGRLKRLKVYVGSEHNHQAQKPQPISFKERKA